MTTIDSDRKIEVGMDYARALTRIAELSTQAGGEQGSTERVILEAAGLFKTEKASVFRLRSDGEVKYLAGVGLPHTLARKLEEVSNAGENADWVTSLLGHSLTPVVVENAQLDPPAPQIASLATLLDAHTIAFAPVHADGKLLGMLVIYHRKPYSYSTEECGLLEVVAALLAGLVARAPSTEGYDSVALKSRLFSVLGHELRTPLTSIMGFTQLIRKRLAASEQGDPRMMEQLDVLWAQAQRLNRLIDTFVDMARIERGEFEITRGQVELLSLLKSASEQAVAQASSHHKVELDIPMDPLWIHGDSKRLEQVFNHVISNSVRYSPQDQPIKVTCRWNSGSQTAVIDVSDQGPGIPASRLKEIFDRSFPVGPLKSGGLGVGLYLSKVIVEAHGGHISAQSAAEQGTTVSIILPV